MKVSVLTILMAFLLAAGIPFGALAGPVLDTDGDTVPDVSDNCSSTPNGAAQAPNNQCDTDQDGYGNACDADTNNDGVIGGPDFGTFTANYGGPGLADTTCDGVVGGPDFGTFTATYGGPVGPSGLSCAGTIPCP